MKRILQNRPLQHIIFWITSYIFLLFHFSVSNSILEIDFIYALLFHLSLVPIVYLNLLVLIPSFLSRKRFWMYGPSVLAAAALGILLHIGTFDYLTDWLFSDYYVISFYNYFTLSQYFFTYIILTTLIHLSRGWFRLRESQNRLARLEREQFHTELQALKAQINPHFLFNSLNNLYALSLKQASETPAVILKLSEALRYMIYEAKETKVLLKKEVEYLHNYIELQRLRLSAGTEVRFEVSGEIKDQKIAPLLYIVLVENAFKHGAKAASANPYVHIKLQVEANSISFSIENSKGKIDRIAGTEAGGIGLQNLRRRLSLLYPDKHTLQITDLSNRFRVELEIH